MIWIKQRCNYEDTYWHNHIKLDDAKENREIIEWLHINGFPLNYIFEWAAEHDEIETINWLYEKEYFEGTFNRAAYHEKGCPWSEEIERQLYTVISET